ncbi:MAG: hypothetical protein DRP33_01210 [Thermotogae bacterium]|nr:MAG: hypothetical protein DRP33_01210 [Thermotogota bacterium]
MAYKYKCLECGKITFSAASLEHQKNKRCEKCGGVVVQIYPPLKLGKILLQLDMINEGTLNEVLAMQRRMMTRAVLGKILLKLNLINAQDLEKALQIQKQMISGSFQ